MGGKPLSTIHHRRHRKIGENMFGFPACNPSKAKQVVSYVHQRSGTWHGQNGVSGRMTGATKSWAKQIAMHIAAVNPCRPCPKQIWTRLLFEKEKAGSNGYRTRVRQARKLCIEKN